MTVFGVLCLLLLVASANSAVDSSDVIFHFRGTDPASYAGFSVSSIGDINGDGYDDIAAAVAVPPSLCIFYGGDTPDIQPDMVFDGMARPNPPIDMDGDGIDDVIVSGLYTANYNQHGIIRFYKGYGDSLGSEPYDSLLPGYLNYGFGWPLAAGYIDDDSLGDIVTWRWELGSTGYVYYFRGKPHMDTIPDWSFVEAGGDHDIRFLDLIDFDGDTHLDIAIALSENNDTLGYVYVFRGPDFQQSPDFILGYPTELALKYGDACPHKYFADWAMSNIGDVNGDGWDDLGVNYCYHGVIYFGGPEADTVFDAELQYMAVDYAGVGDINGDNYSDLATGGCELSRHGTVDIYPGGPGFNAVIDDYVSSKDLPPADLEYIGYRVSSAGDFNGDGFNDILFSCRNFTIRQPGDVFVVKGGPDIATDVSEHSPATLPGPDYRLSNFPNPFNGQTEISFELSERATVSLTVYNVLGERVAQLIEGKVLSAGEHVYSWDTDSGEHGRLPSGVYFSVLDIDGVTNSTKMLLLK